MQDLQREIVNQVAAGTISPEEGAARLEELASEARAGASTSVSTSASTGTPSAAPALGAARQVKVVSQVGSAEIIGDPTIAFAVAEGPHSARQDGDTMVIEQEMLQEDSSFAFGHGESRRVVVNGLDWHRRRLVVRMNPDLALSVSVQAGSVRVEGVRGPIEGDVQAGNLRITDFRNPLNLTVQAGNVSASGRLAGGASKVRCEMGSVRIALDKASSVRIDARATMGKVAIDREDEGSTGSSTRPVTIGAGAGTLDLECTMGNVRVTVG